GRLLARVLGRDRDGHRELGDQPGYPRPVGGKGRRRYSPITPAQRGLAAVVPKKEHVRCLSPPLRSTPRCSTAPRQARSRTPPSTSRPRKRSTRRSPGSPRRKV